MLATTTYPTGLTVDYKDINKNTPSAIKWGTTVTCGVAWVDKCNGIDAPWGLSTMTKYSRANGSTPEVKGSQRAWKWLADYGASTTSIMSIEKGDTINVLAYELIDKTAAFPTLWEGEKIQWHVSQFVF